MFFQGWTYFDPAEAGFKELCTMYDLVRSTLNKDPVIIDADDLLESPGKLACITNVYICI